MLPNKDELKILDEAIAAANAPADKLRPRMTKAFDKGDITIDHADSWLVVAKDEHPDWFAAPPDPAKIEADAANAALAAKAFIGKGNADDRGRLVKAVGEQEANKLAKQFGLSSIGDFRTVGVAPAADDDDADDDAEAEKAKAKDQAKGSSNPWSPKFKGTPEHAASERVRLITVLGTKRCAEMATAAGSDLAGRPLRKRA